MTKLLTRLVDLREGEGVTVLQVFVTLFGLIAAHTMLETARDALFLGKLPPSLLTWVYILLAGLAFVVSAYNERFVRRFGRRNALIFTLMMSAYGTTLLHFLRQSASVVFALYVWSGLLGTILVVQFWLFAGELLTVAQGKRLFGPIASGGVLGAVVGASFAAAALMVIPVGSLLLVSSGIFLITAFFLTTVSTEGTSLPASAAEASARPKATAGLAMLRENPYLVRLAALVALSTAAVLTTDYLFKSAAATSMKPAELGSFFARYYAVLNAVALVVQVFVAGPLVRRLGVVASAAVLPMMLLGGGLGIAVAGGVMTLVLLTKGADGALRHSLHRVTSELLGMPIPPEIRDSSKALLDTVMGRGVQAVTAAALFALASAHLATPRSLAGIVAVLSLLWLGVALGMRRPYVDLFRQALAKGSLESTLATDELDLNSVEAVMEALSSREAARVIAAMELLDEKKRARLIPGLILYHESEEVLLRALEIVSQSDRVDWLPLGERLLGHASESVRVAAVRALATRLPSAVEKAQSDPSPAVRAHAAFCRLHCDKKLRPLQDLTIVGLLSLEGDEGRAARCALLDSIRDQGDERWVEVVLELAQSEDREVVEHAALAMHRVTDTRFIPILIQLLASRDGRTAVREAIVAHGEAALDALERAMQDPATDPRIRLHIPRTVSRFGNQRAADILMELLAQEPSGMVRYKVLRGLGRLVAEAKVKVDRGLVEAQMRKNLVEYLRVLALWAPLERHHETAPPHARGSGSLVRGLVDDKMQQSLERAFRLLQIAHKNENIQNVFVALASKDKRVRAHALEFIDSLPHGASAKEARPGETRELLRLVADDLSPAERVARARAFVKQAPAAYEDAVRLLLLEKDASVAALAAYHALELDVAELTGLVEDARRERPSLTLPSLSPGPPTAPPREARHVG